MGRAQPREMLRDRRLLDADQALEFTHRVLAPPEHGQDSQPPLVGQGAQEVRIERFHGRIFTLANIRRQKKAPLPMGRDAMVEG